MKASPFNLIGSKFGSLTVESIASFPTKNRKAWCRCVCGNKKEVFLSNLKSGKTKSCGCQMHRFKSKDLMGQTFGQLKIIEKLDTRDNDGNQLWHCLCNCGNDIAVSTRRLTRGEVKSCRSCVHSKKLVGKRFGQLEVIAPAPKIKDRNYWLCQCECGNKKIICQGNLVNGHTKSCGCLKEKEHRRMFEGTCLDIISSPKLSKNNTSGYRGVSYIKGKWVAYLTLKGKRYNLGTFSELQDSIEARKKGERRYYRPLIQKYEVLKDSH